MDFSGSGLHDENAWSTVDTSLCVSLPRPGFLLALCLVRQRILTLRQSWSCWSFFPFFYVKVVLGP